jgi:SAM-dependent methyltransferase
MFGIPLRRSHNKLSLGTDSVGAFMKRETSNKIRFVIEDMLPPIIRDSGAFRLAARAVFGNYVDAASEFRKQAPFLTQAEYTDFYRGSPHVHSGTDNSEACLQRIAHDLTGSSVCDVGCGTGYLLRYIRETSRTKPVRLVGAEIVVPQLPENTGIEFFEGRVESLPFKNKEFDTVICTHVIEHILDYRSAIAELRRITAKRLIIVVPMERESLYTFNPHFNFFAYPHSFLRAMIPVPEKYVCEPIGRDIYYREDCS